MMAEIEIQGRDGTFMAYRAAPPSGRGPGIVVIQEIFGVNRWVRSVADELAAHGFVVYAPDLFWRLEPGIQISDKEMEHAFRLYQAFDEGKGVEDIESTIDKLRADPGCTGKVGAVGFCLGGKLAYLAATRTDVDCAVGYYGVGIEKALDEARRINSPLMLHIAKDDQFVPAEAQQEIHRALAANTQIVIFDYPGLDHAFARVGGDHYSREGAAQANQRTLDFFRKHLSESSVREPERRVRESAAREPAAKPKASRSPARAPAKAAPRRTAAIKPAAAKQTAGAKRSAPAKKATAAKPAAKRGAGKKPASAASSRRRSGPTRARKPAGRGRR
jgi:carboxymethylenebutenolidase